MHWMSPLTKYLPWSIMKKSIRRQEDLKPGLQVTLKIESNRTWQGRTQCLEQYQGMKKQPRGKYEREAQTEQTKSIRNQRAEKAEEKRKKMPKAVMEQKAAEILPHASVK